MNESPQRVSTGRMVLYGIASFFLPLIGLIAGIVFLISNEKRAQGLVLWILAGAGSLMYFILGNSQTTTLADTEPSVAAQASSESTFSPPSEPAGADTRGVSQAEWDTKDPDALTNANSEIAVRLLTSGETLPGGGEVDLGDVAKVPWQYYGKLFCSTGVITFVEDYPLGSEMSDWLGGGQVAQITLLNDTGVGSFYVLSGSGDARTNAPATLCGLPVGRSEVENNMGGVVPTAVFIAESMQGDKAPVRDVDNAILASGVHVSAASDEAVFPKSEGSVQEVEGAFPRLSDWIVYLPRVEGCELADGACAKAMWEQIEFSELSPAQASSISEHCGISDTSTVSDWRRYVCALTEAESRGLAKAFVEHASQ